jgi:hypothetical protein
LLKHFELGSYYSHYTITSVFGGVLAKIGIPNQTDTSLPVNHVSDKVVAGRIDFNRFWNMKIEGHFMNGYGDATYRPLSGGTEKAFPGGENIPCRWDSHRTRA